MRTPVIGQIQCPVRIGNGYSSSIALAAGDSEKRPIGNDAHMGPNEVERDTAVFCLHSRRECTAFPRLMSALRFFGIDRLEAQRNSCEGSK